MASLRVVVASATVVVLAAVSPSVLCAQTGARPVAPSFAKLKSQVGIRVGTGELSYIDDDQLRRDIIGVEACLFCGRRALFAEYSRWTKPHTSSQTGYRLADTITTGLRLQWRTRIQPFVAVGVAVGNIRWSVDDQWDVGGVAGAGVTMNTGDRFYVRLAGRFMLTSELWEGHDLAVSAGWRF